MRRTLILGLFGLLPFAAAPAAAQDDDFFDDFLNEDDEDDSSTEEEEVPPLPAPDDGDEADEAGDEDDMPEDTNWTFDPTENQFEFDDDEFEEDAANAGQKPGEDTSAIYRDQIAKAESMDPDEESLAWERYLKKYPSSLFRARIEERMEQLANSMYDERLGASSEGGSMDAGYGEIRFAQPVTLESIDPRSRIHGGLEWGFPEWFNVFADVEYAILRNLSVHGALRKRFSGFSVETGARYALIKSSRTNTLLTGILDLRLGMNPVFPAIRPAVGFGQRFDVLEGLDVQAQLGEDLAFYNTGFSPRTTGGLNVTLAAAPIVRIYGEAAFYMKDLFNPDIGSFRFNTVTFGIKFVARKGQKTDIADVGIGATVPWSTNYWGYHFGSFAADVNYYYAD